MAESQAEARARWREKARRRRARGGDSWSALPQSVRDRVRIPVLERDGYRCRIRGPRCTVVATDVDHIVARKDGGALLDPDNLRAACARCNRGRRDRQTSRARARLGPSREW